MKLHKLLTYLLTILSLSFISIAYDDTITTGLPASEATIAGNSGGVYVQYCQSIDWNQSFSLDVFDVWIESKLGGATRSGLMIEIYLNDSGSNNWTAGTFIAARNLSDGSVSAGGYNSMPIFGNITMDTANNPYLFCARSSFENESLNDRYSGLRSSSSTFGDGSAAEGADESFTLLPTRDLKVRWNVWDVSTDSCTAPNFGNWAVDCSNNCQWTTNQDVPGNMTLTGSGQVDLRANFTFTGSNQYITIASGCTLTLGSSIGGGGGGSSSMKSGKKAKKIKLKHKHNKTFAPPIIYIPPYPLINNTNLINSSSANSS